MISANLIAQALRAEDIVCSEQQFLNNFWGTRFVFDKKSLKKVEAALKKHGLDCETQPYFNQWCVQTFA
jgi:polysaccharide deacetylase 2 family uncharacterized protein YibQ